MTILYRTYLYNKIDTIKFGMALSKILLPGLIVYLRGNLGTGKTELIRALLHGAGYIGYVKSPTYTLAESYIITLAGYRITVIHFDLYRMFNPEEFFEAGFREHFNKKNICIIEWPEKGESVLPIPDINITFMVVGHGRDIELRAMSITGRQCLARLQFTSAF